MPDQQPFSTIQLGQSKLTMLIFMILSSVTRISRSNHDGCTISAPRSLFGSFTYTMGKTCIPEGIVHT